MSIYPLDKGSDSYHPSLGFGFLDEASSYV